MFTSVDSVLSPDALANLAAARERLQSEGWRGLAEVFPALARRIGRAPIGSGIVELPMAQGRSARVDRAQWRACDLAGAILLQQAAPDEAQLIDLYLHGDLEERVILLRALSALPITPATLRVLEEVQRTNMESHFRAATCGSNLVARAREHAQFDEVAFNRLLLKAAFIGVPLGEMLDAADGANPELSRMLQDLATEREAAGRSVWPDTARMIARAPCPGTLARLIGGLEHGDDRLRLAAAEGIALLHRSDLTAFARERLSREPRPEIRTALERAL